MHIKYFERWNAIRKCRKSKLVIFFHKKNSMLRADQQRRLLHRVPRMG
jgi:hypothetical protein